MCPAYASWKSSPRKHLASKSELAAVLIPRNWLTYRHHFCFFWVVIRLRMYHILLEGYKMYMIRKACRVISSTCSQEHETYLINELKTLREPGSPRLNSDHSETMTSCEMISVNIGSCLFQLFLLILGV